MEGRRLNWIILVVVLCVTSFGICWCFTLLFSVLVFVIGLLSFLYIEQGNVEKFYRECGANPLSTEQVSNGGLSRVVKELTSSKKIHKQDQRVTGSDIIDSSLQEILGYVIRDYISPWYNLISLDTEFCDQTVKKTVQTIAINISNRVKEIDWIPYLTTKLVDDAASHLRLFKQARLKVEHNNKAKTSRNSPQKIKQTQHKRNKSETDVSKYFCSRNEKDTRDSEFNGIDQNTLEDYFFELECQMENQLICRDVICTDAESEKEFLSQLVEILFYILLPDEDFQCKPLLFLLREIFSNCVLLPLFNLISDADFINQTIVWLCLSDGPLPGEIFLMALRLTDHCDELKFTKELLSKEIQMLRSRDSGGDSDKSIKQQLSSLLYVNRLIESRLSKLENLDGIGLNNPSDYARLENIKKIALPLEMILKNNVALSYFIDYVSSTGLQSYLFFYLNIEGWKVSVEQQLSDMHVNKLKGVTENVQSVYENIRGTALNIFDQYLGEKSQQKVQINPFLVQALYFKIKNLHEVPSELWFNDVQNAIHAKMEKQDSFLPAFQNSHAYLKLLEELDLIQQNVVEEDAISISSLESAEMGEDKNVMKSNVHSSPNLTSSINKTAKNNSSSSGDFLTVEIVQKGTKHVRSLSDITDLTHRIEIHNHYEESNQVSGQSENGDADKFDNTTEGPFDKDCLKTGYFVLTVKIIETGIVSDKGKTFGVYAIHVSRQFDTGFSDEWHIYRRYSDFYDLHNKVKDKYTTLSKIPFPGKKTFHNTERSVLERRMKMLGEYLHHLCQPDIVQKYHGLQELLMSFLEQGDYDRATSGGPISHTIDTIVNPLKTGMKTIKNMPEQLFNTVDEVVEGLSKVFHTKPTRIPEASKVGASIDIESDDNIPLRIMLLLMDEVFDLKSRNQWLRRRIVTILRQIIRTMFGDIVNRRILDYVSYMTSPKNVAHYLHTFKQAFWPNGNKAEKRPERDEAIRGRTRVAAKAALLTWLSDDLKHIIGSETTRRGLLTIFELFQKPTLNRRLLYVLLEGVIVTLFPDNNMPKTLEKLHSKSKRIQKHMKIR